MPRKKKSLPKPKEIQVSINKYYISLPDFFEDITGKTIIDGKTKQRGFLEEVQKLDEQWKQRGIEAIKSNIANQLRALRALVNFEPEK